MTRKLAEGRMMAYASGNFGKALVFGGADLTILFLLTDVLGLGGTTAGWVMLAALCGDLVFDLVAARLVIRLRHAGKGYRWMVAIAATPCALAFALLYAMPVLGARQLWMLAAALLVFRGAYAVIDVPHNALMTQVTSDSRARGRVSGYRLFFSTASALIVATILTPLVQQAGSAQAFDQLALTGAVAGGLFAVTMMLCAWTSGGGQSRPVRPSAEQDGIRVPLRDPMVIGMGLLALLTGFAAPAFGRMLLYIGSYVVHRPDLVATLLLALTAGQFAGVLLWTAMTGRFSKSLLLAMGHGVCAAGLVAFSLCLSWPVALMACAAVIGFGLASVFMLPWGLLADAVDVVEWRHGRRFETGLFAFYLVVVKASGAASTSLIGWTLGWLRYVPAQPQAVTVQAGMLGLGLGIPLVGSLAAILLMRRFDLGHARHGRLLFALDRRRQSGADPVSGLKRGLVKSSGDGEILAGGLALSAQARQSMSRSMAAPAAVRS
ncbi:glycoside/pentoside/hexuronide:cation symporter, GPH family [Sphingobium sp. AP50]|nr:MFS transporter [Sphingobium sp. AP50]SEI66433.1 glycoside/pentoside/hexuronide:cation symporter, GPH family [Sphingobium sp. AP50]